LQKFCFLEFYGGAGVVRIIFLGVGIHFAKCEKTEFA